jgi:hypothetical protein
MQRPILLSIWLLVVVVAVATPHSSLWVAVAVALAEC